MKIISHFFEDLDIDEKDFQAGIGLYTINFFDHNTPVSMKDYLLGIDSAISKSNIFLLYTKNIHTKQFAEMMTLFCQSHQLMVNFFKVYQILYHNTLSHKKTMNKISQFPYHNLCQTHFLKNEELIYEYICLEGRKSLEQEKYISFDIDIKYKKDIVSKLHRQFQWYKNFIQSISNETVSFYDIRNIEILLDLCDEIFHYRSEFYKDISKYMTIIEANK